MTVIRKGISQDHEALARIISSSEAWTCYGIDFDKAVAIFREMTETVYLAEDQGQILGFVALRTDGVGNIGAYIRMVAVREDQRSRGIGRQLIEYAGGLAQEKYPNLFLICSTDNLRAQKFYEANGFERVGLLNDLVVAGHPEILYRKSYGTLR